ncbi:MAG TPA: hypothetical protein DEP84_20425 [Chloroflexi bacterium]|nr:hypothetical protein [Chloroflexota bacterium]
MDATNTGQIDRKVWYLQRLDLFLSLTEQEIEEIASGLNDYYVPTGAELFHERQREAIYLIKEGAVQLYTHHEQHRATLALLGPGRLFGLSEDFGESRSMIGATALEPSYICSATWPQILQLFGRFPDVMGKMTQALIEQIFYAETWLERRNVSPPRVRLAELLLELCDDFGQPSELGIKLKFRLTQRDIGGMLNLSRETISRLIGQFRRAGWIGRQRGLLIIRDRGALQAVVSGHDTP